MYIQGTVDKIMDCSNVCVLINNNNNRRLVTLALLCVLMLVSISLLSRVVSFSAGAPSGGFLAPV